VSDDTHDSIINVQQTKADGAKFRSVPVFQSFWDAITRCEKSHAMRCTMHNAMPRDPYSVQ
jgi:hypothetical protein